MLIENKKTDIPDADWQSLKVRGRVSNLSVYGEDNRLIATIWPGEEKFLAPVSLGDNLIIPGKEVSG